MINFQKSILSEIAKRKITINQAALAAGISPVRLYGLRNGKPLESVTLEKILNSLGAELKFPKGVAK
jgi:DNA-binding Xre family transcriptional regulator